MDCECQAPCVKRLAGMGQDRAHHDGKRHHTDRPGHPQMLRRRRPEPAGREDAGCQCQSAKRHEGVARVKDGHQGVGEGAVPRPTGQADKVQEPRQQQNATGRRVPRRDEPEDEGGQQNQQRELVKTLHRRRGKEARAAPDQPVAREGRHQTASDHGNQHDRCSKAKPQASPVCGVRALRGLPMKEEVSRREHGQQAQDDKVSPRLPRHDFARDGGGEHDRKGQVYRGDEERRHPGGHRDHDPSEQPEQGQCAEAPADDGQAACPVRHRGQHEPRDHRAEIAVKKLMRVPADRVERSWQREMAGQHRQPKHHCDRGPNARAEEERARAIVQDRGAGPGPHLLGGCRGHGGLSLQCGQAGAANAIRRYPAAP